MTADRIVYIRCLLTLWGLWRRGVAPETFQVREVERIVTQELAPPSSLMITGIYAAPGQMKAKCDGNTATWYARRRAVEEDVLYRILAAS